MFNRGNKIVITGSSLKKNNIGPKTSSVGFIKHVNDFFIKLDNYFITTMRIIFYKFGNEKKYRIETKTIAVLFPNKIETIDDFNFRKQQSFLQKLNDKTNQDLKKIIGVKNINTISPVYTDIFKNNKIYHERMSYLLSLWTFNNLHLNITIIQKLSLYDRYKIKNIKNIMFVLNKGLNDSAYRHNVAYNVANDTDEYIKFLKVLKLITIKSKQYISIYNIVDIKNASIKEERFDYIYKMLYLNLFNNNYFILGKKFISEQSTFKKRQIITTMITNLNHVKHKLIINGQKYI